MRDLLDQIIVSALDRDIAEYFVLFHYGAEDGFAVPIKEIVVGARTFVAITRRVPQPTQGASFYGIPVRYKKFSSLHSYQLVPGD